MARTVGVADGQGGCGRLRAFAPFLLWCCLALSVVAWDVHRKIAAGTKLTFRILVEGEQTRRAISVTLDGTDFESGQRVSMGRRTLSIDARGLEPFERTFQVWFGEHDLGDIDLKRSRGTLTIAAEPQPRAIRVTGPEFDNTTTNREAKFVALLIGDYTIRADFGLFSEERRIEVKRNEEARAEFRPAVGALALTARPTNASFRLAGTGDSRIRLEGSTPTQIENLPAGDYDLSVWRGDYVMESRVSIRHRETNALEIEFAYATLKFKTMPTGATVFSDHAELGRTPLTLNEVLPGKHRFQLAMKGYATAPITVDAMTNATHTIATNLVNERYAAAMERARRLSEGNFADFPVALASVQEALRIAPNDSEALALKAGIEAAAKKEQMRIAELQKHAEHAAAEEQRRVETAAADATRKAEQAAQRQFPAQVFDKLMESSTDADLFPKQVWTVKADVGKTVEAMRRVLATEGSGWKSAGDSKVDDRTFTFVCTATTKALSNVKRYATLVVGQVAPGEVQIHARFWDYQSTKIGLSLTKGLTKDGLVPVHPDHFRPEDRAAIEARRKAVPEEFKTKLLNELK